MKIVSFNVNSIRQRLHQLEALLDTQAPDIIGLQETKVTDEDFPFEAIEAMGLEAAVYGQKTHYGVALLVRQGLLMQDIVKGFDSDAEDAQRRLITARVQSAPGQSLTVINGYFPQGENRDHPVKFPAKQRFYADLLTHLQTHHRPDEALIVLGDFNVAPEDSDLGIGEQNVKRWLRNGSTSFLPEERDWYQQLLDWGLVDSYRAVHPDRDDQFSWFDYRSRGFEREPRRGLRIDHVLCTRPLVQHLTDSGIDYAIRAMDKPSDHCPVWSSFKLDGAG